MLNSIQAAAFEELPTTGRLEAVATAIWSCELPPSVVQRKPGHSATNVAKFGRGVRGKQTTDASLTVLNLNRALDHESVIICLYLDANTCPNLNVIIG